MTLCIAELAGFSQAGCQLFALMPKESQRCLRGRNAELGLVLAVVGPNGGDGVFEAPDNLVDRDVPSLAPGNGRNNALCPGHRSMAEAPLIRERQDEGGPDLLEDLAQEGSAP